MSNKSHGFTMVELLIVVTVIAVLAAIAIPQFAAYRARSYNTSALSDLRNLKIMMESHYSEVKEYPIFP